MNKIYRNTIIISSAWVLTLILGLFYIYGYQKKIKTRLEEEEKVKSERLSELQILENNLFELQNYYNHLHELSIRYSGTLASFVSPGETFDYIRRETEKTKSSITLNMEFKTEEPFNEMMKRTYELRGSGEFKDIYNLLWFLENGPVFYCVNSLMVEKVDANIVLNDNSLKEDESLFTITVFGFDRKEGPKITELNRDFGNPKPIANLFNNNVYHKSPKIKPLKPKSKNYYAARNVSRKQPEIKVAKPKNTRGLPEISSQCQVMAITPFSVLIKNEKGNLIKLRKGDEIFGGNLSSLDARSGQAVFKYNGDFDFKTIVLNLKK